MNSLSHVATCCISMCDASDFMLFALWLITTTLPSTYPFDAYILSIEGLQGCGVLFPRKTNSVPKTGHLSGIIAKIYSDVILNGCLFFLFLLRAPQTAEDAHAFLECLIRYFRYLFSSTLLFVGSESLLARLGSRSVTGETPLSAP